MSSLTTRCVVDAGTTAWPIGPRHDIVDERPSDEQDDGAAPSVTYVADAGPFTTYRRTVETSVRPDGRLDVSTTTRWRVAVPFFGWLYTIPIRRTLARPPRSTSDQPWWAPPDRLDARASSTLGALAAAAIVAGYLGTLLSQTITFTADDLGDASRTEQGVVLAAVRVGVPLALVVTSIADRRGRRVLLLASAVAGCLLTATGALAPTMAWFGLSQTLARACSTAVGLLISVVAVEEMPRGSRAYAVSVVVLAAALGSGLCVALLPLTAIDVGGWRLLYLAALLGLPVLWAVRRHLPESRRFEARHRIVGMAGHWRRLTLLAGSAFLLTVFTAPASQFQNEFLRTERGFSAANLALFTLITSTPAGLGVAAGGRLADTHGRRRVAAVGLLGLTVGTVATYLSSGWSMWTWSLLGGVVAGATVPALGVYGPELFPTSLRGRANGIITMVGVAGSVVGLLVAGALADRIDGVGPALAVLAVGPLVLIGLVLGLYPETASVELEDINPEDRSLELGVIRDA